MPSLSKSFRFTVYTGLGTTATSVEIAYPMYPMTTSGTQEFVSFKEQGAGYYGTTNGLHSLTVTTTPTFVGTATVQATLATDPIEADWFDITDVAFEYLITDPDYIAPAHTGANPYIGQHLRTDYVNFTGQFTWLRTNVLIDSGAVMKVSYNY
jgi:hypothetical protein